MLEAERALFADRNPRSAALAVEAAGHWLKGVPMHWMVDWGTPFPLFVESAAASNLSMRMRTATLISVSAIRAPCLAIRPLPSPRPSRRQAARGLTTMLPGPDVAIAGAVTGTALRSAFLAGDRNGVGRQPLGHPLGAGGDGTAKLLVMNGCYHGAVDDTFVTLENGKPRNRPGLVGEVRDVTENTVVIEFNDIAALERALAGTTLRLSSPNLS